MTIVALTVVETDEGIYLLKLLASSVMKDQGFILPNQLQHLVESDYANGNHQGGFTASSQNGKVLGRIKLMPCHLCFLFVHFLNVAR